jgi:hypothetical protein
MYRARWEIDPLQIAEGDVCEIGTGLVRLVTCTRDGITSGMVVGETWGI